MLQVADAARDSRGIALESLPNSERSMAQLTSLSLTNASHDLEALVKLPPNKAVQLDGDSFPFFGADVWLGLLCPRETAFFNPLRRK